MTFGYAIFTKYAFHRGRLNLITTEVMIQHEIVLARPKRAYNEKYLSMKKINRTINRRRASVICQSKRLLQKKRKI